MTLEQSGITERAELNPASNKELGAEFKIFFLKIIPKGDTFKIVIDARLPITSFQYHQFTF